MGKIFWSVMIFECEKFYEEIKKLIWRLGEYYNT